jgi:hypothetical protein
MARRNRTDEDCILWCCTQCAASGAVTLDTESDRLVYGVMETIERAHRQKTPMCLATAGASGWLIIRPNNWYQEAAGLFAPEVAPEDQPPTEQRTAEPREEWLPYKDA